MTRYIILDRDGVINHDSNEYIKTPDEWLPINGSLAAIARLNQAGFQVVLATNQAGIGRGILSTKMLTAIHDKMCLELAKYNGKILDIFYCPHHPKDNCQCRKPRPGMLLSFAAKYQVALDDVYMVGDRITDVAAARAAGAIPILLSDNKGIDSFGNQVAGVATYATLLEFVEHLLT